MESLALQQQGRRVAIIQVPLRQSLLGFHRVSALADAALTGAMLLLGRLTLPRFHHKMDRAAFDSLSIQPLIDNTSIPEAKNIVGGVRST